jgi:ribose transport system permease protein/erythritol transport system permease protein
MTQTTVKKKAPQKEPTSERGHALLGALQRFGMTLLTQRPALLGLVTVVLLLVMSIMDAQGTLSGPYDVKYLASSTISLVGLAMLALAQLIVIVSGRGGIDLSVGSMVSLSGIFFGFSYGVWGWSLFAAIVATMLIGAVLGGINGVLIAYAGFPPLIMTLATYYAYRSLALVFSGQKPVNSERIQEFYGAAKAVPIPGLSFIPPIPLGVITFLIPTAIIVWIVMNKTVYGRKLYAIGTNDVAALWTGINVKATRMGAFVLSGLISSLVAIYTVAQFASARPDAGTSGSGMALPAITIAVLGGVAITGGIGRVGGVLIAALLIVWLNAGILLAIPGNIGAQTPLLALGLVLIGASLLNAATKKRFGGI